MHGILITALVAALIQLVEHYFPWRLALGKDLPRLAAYVIGVLGMIVPLSVLYGMQSLNNTETVIALWSTVAASGAAVSNAYGLDWVLRRLALAGDLGEILQIREREHGTCEADIIAGTQQNRDSADRDRERIA